MRCWAGENPVDMGVGSCGLLANMAPKLHLRSQEMIGGGISGGIAYANDASAACVPFGLLNLLVYLVISDRI